MSLILCLSVFLSLLPPTPHTPQYCWIGTQTDVNVKIDIEKILVNEMWSCLLGLGGIYGGHPAG